MVLSCLMVRNFSFPVKTAAKIIRGSYFDAQIYLFNAQYFKKDNNMSILFIIFDT
jgi:hypothetical protein